MTIGGFILGTEVGSNKNQMAVGCQAAVNVFVEKALTPTCSISNDKRLVFSVTHPLTLTVEKWDLMTGEKL